MTVLEFWGCALITFGPAIAMFSLTVANDSIKIILLISSSFFWLLSFLVVAICWSFMSFIGDNTIRLFIGACLAVLSQEGFRYLFHIVTKKAQVYLAKIMNDVDIGGSGSEGGRRPAPLKPSTSATATRTTNEIQHPTNDFSISEFQDRIPLSYVSGLGFGLMNGAFSIMNVLTDSIGPGTIGLKGDSSYFLLVSSLTALAFILLNVAWSILMSESIEKSNRKLASLVVSAHLLTTLITFLNRFNLQLITVLVIYALTILSGLTAFKVAGLHLRRLIGKNRSEIQR